MAAGRRGVREAAKEKKRTKKPHFVEIPILREQGVSLEGRLRKTSENLSG